VTAISYIHGAWAQSVHLLKQYYERVESGQFATERGIVLTLDDKRRRQVITQIMCNFWVDLGADGYFARELEALRAHEKDGLLKISGTQVELTTLGRLFVRNVAMVFDAYLGREGKDRPTFSRTV
jgi:oxygen-independent coproporphyrinogen-3 oxidase